MGEQSDFDLLHLWRGGDERAASELLRRHFDLLYKFFRTKLDDHVDDLVQRTFLAAVEGRDRIRDDLGFRAYLLGIARKQLLFHIRTRMRREKRFAIAEVSAVDLAGSPSKVVAGRQEQELLLAALRRIPIDLQTAIELFYYEGLKGAEIAAVLEISEGTVRSRLRRARELLKEQLAAMEIPEELARSTLHTLVRAEPED